MSFGRGGIADLSIGTLSFADIIATSRADIGDVLYPTTGVNLPETELPSQRESQTVSLSIDRWLYTNPAISKRRWFIEGEVKAKIGTKKPKRQSNITSRVEPVIHRFSQLEIQPESCLHEDWLYSDRYKTSTGSSDLDDSYKHQKKNLTAAESMIGPECVTLMDKRFFSPELWTSFMDGKKNLSNKKSSHRKNLQKSKSRGTLDEVDEEGDDEKEDAEEGEDEVGLNEEEEIDEDDPDYDNNYFDNGEDDEGMGSGGEGGDEGGVF